MNKSVGPLDPIFAQFHLHSSNLSLLHQIKPANQYQKTKSLIEGCLKRNQQKLYKGIKHYYEDLQTVFDYDRHNAPELFKLFKIVINKDQTDVLVQCFECARYTVVHKYCPKCENIHYCQETCEFKAKLRHEDACKERVTPNIDKSLQVEVHFGQDLGENVEIYYQHEGRLSLELKGQKFLEKTNQYFKTHKSAKIQQNYAFEIAGNHLKYRKIDEAKFVIGGQPITLQTMKDIIKIYEKNRFLSEIQLYLIQQGAILQKYVQQSHNNYIHLVYIFSIAQ